MMLFGKTRFVVYAFIVVAAIGCSREQEGEKFKLVASPSGELYRIQSMTGVLNKVEGTNLLAVRETERVKLKVGAIYVFETGSTMKYLGDGKFEQFKSEVLTVDEYLKEQEMKKKP